MTTASELAEAVVDFMERRDPGVEFRAGPGEGKPHYDGKNIVGNMPGGSQNWGPILGANALIHWYNKRNWRRVDDILTAWGEYAKRDFMTTEAYSCNIYHHWITYPTKIAYNVALMRKRQGVADGLLKHMRTNRVLSALSAGWVKSKDGFKAYPVQMCGARSWSSPAKYMLTGNGFAAAELSGSLGLIAYSPVARLRRWSGRGDVSGISAPERVVLMDLIHNRVTPDTLSKAVAWLRDGPGFKADARIVRTSKMVAWCNESTVNTGSTSYMMAHAWYNSGRPTYYGNHKWVRDKNHAWVTIDPPGRVKGAQGRGYIKDGIYYAQRTKSRTWKNGFKTMPESWFDELSGKEVPGWRSQLRFVGTPVYDIKVGRGGVVPVGNGNTDPPVDPPVDPPDSGPGWHTIPVSGTTHLKFTTQAARDALAAINAGGNHIKTSGAAFLPAELARVKAALQSILGG